MTASATPAAAVKAMDTRRPCRSGNEHEDTLQKHHGWFLYSRETNTLRPAVLNVATVW